MTLFKGQRRKGMIVTTIREAIKEQRKSIKNRSFKEQFSFFWEYYGIKTICLILAIAILIAFIVSMVIKKEYAFTGVFFGAAVQDSSEDYLVQFGQASGICANSEQTENALSFCATALNVYKRYSLCFLWQCNRTFFYSLHIQ